MNIINKGNTIYYNIKNSMRETTIHIKVKPQLAHITAMLVESNVVELLMVWLPVIIAIETNEILVS